MSQKRRNQRGIALIWAAVVIFVMIGVVGLSLDWGKLALNVHQLHNGADAAALAGALMVKFDQPRARTMAITIAGENNAENLPVSVLDNPGNDAAGEVVLGRWIAQRLEFIPTTDAPNAVKVVGRRLGQRADAPPLALNWGPVFNTSSVNASRHAIAMSRGSSGAGLLTLLEYPPKDGIGIGVGGNDLIRVRDGDIQDNSQSITQAKEGFRASGTFTIECDELNTCGEIYPTPDTGYWQSVDYSVNQNTKVPLPDPFVEVHDLWSSPPQSASRPGVIPPPPPDTAYPSPVPMETHPYGIYGMAVQVDAAGNPILTGGGYTSTGYDASSARPIEGSVISTYGTMLNGLWTITLVPGYYPGGVKLTNGNKVKLLPGIYEFGGGVTNGDNSGLVVNGGELEADDVMLYITASNHAPNYPWGRVQLTGGNVTIHEAYDPADPEAEPYPNYVGSNYKYLAIFQDRANQEEATITGNGQLSITGTLYFPTTHVAFSGGNIDAGTQLIAGSIETQGGTSLTINYDGRFFVPLFLSILVE
jgi:hypothetical protein